MTVDQGGAVSQLPEATAVVLAAGRGTRMRSGVPKVLHRAGGRPLVAHVLDSLRRLELSGGLVAVVSAGGRVQRELAESGEDVDFVVQDPPAGTADAVRTALERLGDYPGRLLVAQGATPLVTTETFRALLEAHVTRGARATVLTAARADPFGYGRILRDAEGELVGIVEERDATEEERLLTEVNSGAYVFDASGLAGVWDALDSSNDQGEYYLPDVIGLLRSKGEALATYTTTAEEVFGVKSRSHLAAVESVLRRRACERWMAEGVTIVDPATTYIDASAVLAKDAVVRPFTFLEGRTVVGEGAEVGPQARIVDSEVGPGAQVSFAVVVGSSIGPEASVGPFASLRKGTRLERKAKVGSFVEVKQSRIGEGGKVPHLAYVGDADIGSGVNVGAGTITANWDGRSKHPTVIEDDAYIGSNTVLVAPSRVGRRAATGAGAVVRGDVPDDALAVGVPARIIAGKGNRMASSRNESESPGAST
jgi:bifunctional UDP-N-acetylglucosamine pyrophosphorylase/glucosamine-1-phosphate N-acetyltransferase